MYSIMKSRTLVVLAAAGLMLASCTKDKQGDQGEGTGRLRVQLSADPAVTEQATRALELQAPADEQFSLRVVKSDGKYDRSWDDITKYPGEGYYIKTGYYTATAVCGNPSDEGFGKPAFGVTENFSIIHGTTAQVEMTAKLTNTAATVGYTTAFEHYFPEHYAVITTGNDNELSFEENPAEAAYFEAKPFTVTIYYKDQRGDEDSAQFNVTTGVTACKYFNIVFDVNKNSGGVGGAAIEVKFDGRVEVVKYLFETGVEDEPQP